MSGFLTERQLEDSISLPLSLPLTQILPGDSIILSALKLDSSNQRLSHRFVQIKILDRSPGAPPNSPGRVDAGYGFVYGGIYDSDGLLIAGTTTECPTDTADVADGLTVAQGTLPLLGSRTLAVDEITGPASGSDEYTYRITNNCSTETLLVTVAGSWRLDLNV